VERERGCSHIVERGRERGKKRGIGERKHVGKQEERRCT
jgi:hypothetical protein